MDEAYWDRAARTYDQSIFDVLANDRAGRIAHHLDRLASKRKAVADYGCGPGKMLPLLAKRFRHVYAMDISRACLDQAEDACGHLDNIDFLKVDLARPRRRLPEVHVAVSINAVITPSLGLRAQMLKVMSRQLKPRGHLLLVVPAMESALFTRFRLIQWNLRSGLNHGAAVRAGFEQSREESICRLNQGLVPIEDVATKHYLEEELVALLAEHRLKAKTIKKIEYEWTTEFDEPPAWMQAPYPWDWLVVAQKRT